MKLTFVVTLSLFLLASYIKGACNCGKEFEIDTVCGFNGVTYKNPCFAKCNAALIKHYGACSQTNTPCGCPDDTNTVCDLNGETYQNECVANCKGKVAIPLSLCNLNQADENFGSQEIPLVIRNTGNRNSNNSTNYNYKDVDYDDVDPMSLYYGVPIVDFYLGRFGDEFIGLRKPQRRNAGEVS